MSNINGKIFFVCLLLMLSVGMKAQTMEWLCRPGEYTDIKYLGNNMFKVKNINEKWGILSSEGKLIVAAEHDSITSFTEDRSLVLQGKENRIICMINSNGEIVQNFKDQKIYATKYPFFKEGLLGFKEETGLCGYLNTQGNVSIKAKFYLAAPFQNGIATVQYSDDGYFGLINRSGGSAIVSDVKFKFLSSLVDGQLLAVTSYSRGGDLLRIMKLDGNKLKKTKQLESMMFVDLSDDFTYLVSQNGHHYFIDEQWRITGANYKFKLPYEVEDKAVLVIESSELLSKQYAQDGYQITYKGSPILEQTFSDVNSFDKRYAIVTAKNKHIGILKLNPLARIDLVALTEPVLFRHNPFHSAIPIYVGDSDLGRYVGIDVNLTNVDVSSLKCYINDDGYLYYAPIREERGEYKMYLPYFQPDTLFHHEKEKELDIAITYDGLDWMHKRMSLSSKHEEGYVVALDEKVTFGKKGVVCFDIIVQSVGDNFDTPINVDISNKKKIVLTGKTNRITITENVPEGMKKTFNYVVSVSEKGCPTLKRELTKTIYRPIVDLE